MRVAREASIGPIPIQIVLNVFKTCGIRATRRNDRNQPFANGIDSDRSNLILAHPAKEQYAVFIAACWRADTELFSGIDCNTEH